MVLYLNSVLQANMPVGVSCIEGRSLEMEGGLPFRQFHFLHLDQACLVYFPPILTDGRVCSLDMIKG